MRSLELGAMKTVRGTSSLPARLDDARNFSLEGETAEAQTAYAELPQEARGRPQSWQRLCWRDLNLGFLASLTRFAVVAIFCSLSDY